jgi:hypothetical protein
LLESLSGKRTWKRQLFNRFLQGILIYISFDLNFSIVFFASSLDLIPKLGYFAKLSKSILSNSSTELIRDAFKALNAHRLISNKKAPICIDAFF